MNWLSEWLNRRIPDDYLRETLADFAFYAMAIAGLLLIAWLT